MGPVRNPTQRTKNWSSKCVHDCAQLSVHNTAQNSSDKLLSYLQASIIAQMLSIGGEEGWSFSSCCCHVDVIKMMIRDDDAVVQTVTCYWWPCIDCCLLVIIKQGLLVIYDATVVRRFALSVIEVTSSYVLGNCNKTAYELVQAFKAGRAFVSNVYNMCVDTFAFI